MKLKITLAGEPQSKQRHRCSCNKNKVIVYDSQYAVMQAVKKNILREWNKKFDTTDQTRLAYLRLFQTAVSFHVNLNFYFSTNISLPECKKNILNWNIIEHTKKPDVDNLAKLYLDCATGILWQDDCMISSCNIKKFYHNNARTEIIVTPIFIKMSQELSNFYSKISIKELNKIVDDMKLVSSSLDKLMPLQQYDHTNKQEKLKFESLAHELSKFLKDHESVIKKILNVGFKLPS